MSGRLERKASIAAREQALSALRASDAIGQAEQIAAMFGPERRTVALALLFVRRRALMQTIRNEVVG